MKLNKPYNNQKTKDLLEKHFKKPFDNITEEEMITTCSLWYAMMLEFVDTDKDTNCEVMQMQMTLKGHFWEK